MTTIINTIGRLTKDIELKTSNKGCVYANFSLAVNDGFGENQKAMFYECTAFGADAERLVKAKAKKGSLIQVNGKFGVSEFTRKNGESGYSLRITVLSWGYIPGASGQKDANDGNSNNGVNSGNTQVPNQVPGENTPGEEYNGTTNLDDEVVAA